MRTDQDAPTEPGRASVRFLLALPRITVHARVMFRGVRCPQRRADCIAEAVALCWHWYTRLVAKGRDPDRFISALAAYAARQVRCGRALCGQMSSKDALSPLAQARRGFATQVLPEHDSSDAQPALQALVDNTHTPVPIQAAFRLDFPRWLASLSAKKRLLAERLMAGDRACEVAALLQVSPGRVTQLRGELYRDWHRFHAGRGEQGPA